MLTTLLLSAALLAPGDTTSPDWYYGSFRSALSDAQKSEQLVMLVFMAEDSEYSKKLAAETLVDERVVEKLGHLIVFRPEMDSRRGQKLAERYSVESYPSIIFARGDGGIEDAIYGYIPPEPLLGELKRITHAQGTVSYYQGFVDEEPENLQARFQLASILGNLGAHEEAQEHLDTIYELDPDGTHVVSARMAWKEQKSDVAAAAGSDDTSGWELDKLYTYLDSASNAEFRYEARIDMANMELARGDYGTGFGQFQLAWNDAPPASARGFAFDVANFYLNNARQDDGSPMEGLPDDAGSFALELALYAVEAAERQRDEGMAEFDVGMREGDGDGDSSDGDMADSDSDSDGHGLSLEDKRAEKLAGWNRWVAEHHSTLARAYAAEGLPDLAAESMALAVELDGDSQEYIEQLSNFRSALN